MHYVILPGGALIQKQCGHWSVNVYMTTHIKKLMVRTMTSREPCEMCGKLEWPETK